MQNDKIKISIIMPVYNVKDYLKKAVDSILNQKFKDFELFLVDDGSTDGSSEICDELKSIDDRIIVIHQKNLGAHNARNNALVKARGRYVCFFDSDDYIDSDMLKDLYEIAERYDSELVISGFYIHTYYDNENYISLDYIPNIDSEVVNFDNKSDFRKNAYKNFDKNMFYSPWNKLYKLSYLNEHKITFPITYRDDFPFVLNVIKDIEKVSFTKKEYYHFLRKRSDSETQKYVENFYDKREEEHRYMIDLYTYWGLIDDEKSFEMIARRYIDRLIECMVNLFNKKCTLSEKEKKDTINKYLQNKNVDKCIRVAKPSKFYLKLMYIPIKLKNTNLCFMMAKFINLIKGNNIKLFSILKTNR